jgi:hypothetical protein
MIISVTGTFFDQEDLQEIGSNKPLLRPYQRHSLHLPHSRRLACGLALSFILVLGLSTTRASGFESNFLGIVDDVAVATIVVARGDTKVGAPLGSEHAGVRHPCNSESEKYNPEGGMDLRGGSSAIEAEKNG